MALRRLWVWGVLALILHSVPVAAESTVSFAQSSLKVVTATGRPHSFTVELAETPEQLARGLMFREKMADDAGMLFNFGQARPVSMWMKNTLIGLDMLFIDEMGRVTGIHERAVPHSEAVISSPGRVKAVLEINAGLAARLGLKAGDRVDHHWFHH